MISRVARATPVPQWKKVVALLCAAYALFAWAMPLLMIPFVPELPFVHESSVYERLAVSVVASLTVVLVPFAMDARRVTEAVLALEPSGSRWKNLGHWSGVVAGLVMVTISAAFLSANSFGLLARILPSQPYVETVLLESVDFHGSRRPNASVSLQYASSTDGRPRFLVLAKRLFDYPRLAPGDVLELRGEYGPIGFYVKEFRLVRKG